MEDGRTPHAGCLTIEDTGRCQGHCTDTAFVSESPSDHPYSGLSPAAFATRSVSSTLALRYAPNSAGVPPTRSTPRSASRLRMVASSSPLLMAALSLSMIGRGVAAGARMPSQELDS